MGLPHVRGADGTEIIPQLDIRFALDLYAGVRPIRTYAGLPGPLANPRAADIDLVLVRENTEGLFHARGRGRMEGQATRGRLRHDEDHARRARPASATSRSRSRDSARRRASSATSPTSTRPTSSARWRSGARSSTRRARAIPDIATEHAYVDAMALNLVMQPWDYDVLVTENMFGDILSDLIAALVGGMGMAPSADIGDQHALFQPAHGTAPDIAGQGIANPTAMILSAAMMLDWLAERHDDAALADGARAIEAAVQSAFARAQVRPREFGGTQRHRRRRARGAGTAVSSPPSAGADRRIPRRVAMVGAGYFAQFQLEGWRDAGATLCRAARPDPRARPRAGRAASAWPGPARRWPRCSMPSARRWSTSCCRRRRRRAVVQAALERGIPDHLPEAVRHRPGAGRALTERPTSDRHAAGGARELPLRCRGFASAAG